VGHRVTSFDEPTLRSLSATFDQLAEQGVLTPVITLDRLRTSLSASQRAVVDQVIGLRPQDYGVSTPYAGDLEPVPADLVTVRGQQYITHGTRKTLGDKYVPRRVFAAYTALNAAFADGYPGRALLIQSCYRSPAYQVVVFLSWLTRTYHGDIAATIRHASPPSYSQHTIASKAAIDFKNCDGSPSDDQPEDFRDTVEYGWLREQAGDFGFYESWPADNEFGMRPEPWHWQYRPGAAPSVRFTGSS
jgi:LAS superfamily LD-carboxypeptidase LdcB